MRFTQCIATKTGVLENRIINFSDDITVICGPNESGKTLTMKAMTDSLLGYGAESRILEDETWKNLQINLTVEDASSRLKIIRTGTSHLAVTDFFSSAVISNGVPTLRDVPIVCSNALVKVVVCPFATEITK